MSKRKAPFFEIDAHTIDGLIRMDLLHPSRRLDPDAVFDAVKAALRDYIGEDVPPPPVKFTEPHEVSPAAQQRYNDLVVEQLLVVMVRTGLMSASTAVSVMNAVLAKAKQTRAGEGVAQSAAFGRQALAWQMREEGLV